MDFFVSLACLMEFVYVAADVHPLVGCVGSLNDVHTTKCYMRYSNPDVNRHNPSISRGGRGPPPPLRSRQMFPGPMQTLPGGINVALVRMVRRNEHN